MLRKQKQKQKQSSNQMRKGKKKVKVKVQFTNWINQKYFFFFFLEQTKNTIYKPVGSFDIVNRVNRNRNILKKKLELGCFVLFLVFFEGVFYVVWVYDPSLPPYLIWSFALAFALNCLPHLFSIEVGWLAVSIIQTTA